MNGIELIEKERKEQIEKHGFDLYYDSRFNAHGQLAEAASILAYDQRNYLQPEDIIDDHLPRDWDKEMWAKMVNKEMWAKMVNKSYEERLIISGALIAAELDRIMELWKVKENESRRSKD